jgi:hypothetical protein
VRKALLLPGRVRQPSLAGRRGRECRGAAHRRLPDAVLVGWGLVAHRAAWGRVPVARVWGRVVAVRAELASPARLGEEWRPRAASGQGRVACRVCLGRLVGLEHLGLVNRA